MKHDIRSYSQPKIKSIKGEISMNTETPNTTETAIVSISQETEDLVNENMPHESDEVKNETKALIEAIKKRAQVETKNATEFTRDTYLTAVRQVREKIEHDKLFDPDRIAYSFKLIQMDAEKNWESIVKEVSTLGDRLAEAAKAAWDVLTAPRTPSDKL